MKNKLQSYINRLSGKPELFNRYCRRFNKNKNFNYDFSGCNFFEKDFSNFNFSFSDFSFSDFSFSDFSFSNFRSSNFSSSNFSSSNFSFSNFSYSNFSFSDFSFSDFSFSDSSFSNFSFSNFSFSNFRSSNFRSSNFRSSNFSSSNFSYSDFSSSDFSFNVLKKLLNIKIKMKILGFKETKNYWIAYKTFGETFNSPKKWKIKNNNIIKEHLDYDIWKDCSYGINVGTLDWCKNNCENYIWEVHIYKTSDIVIPFWSDGKIRVSECKLIKKINI